MMVLYRHKKDNLDVLGALDNLGNLHNLGILDTLGSLDNQPANNPRHKP